MSTRRKEQQQAQKCVPEDIEIDEHINAAHKKERKYGCTECGYRTLIVKNLAFHYKNEHEIQFLSKNTEGDRCTRNIYRKRETNINKAKNRDIHECKTISTKKKLLQNQSKFKKILGPNDGAQDDNGQDNGEEEDDNDIDHLMENAQRKTQKPKLDYDHVKETKPTCKQVRLSAPKSLSMQRRLALKYLASAKKILLAKKKPGREEAKIAIHRDIIEDVNHMHLLFNSSPRPKDFLRAMSITGLTVLIESTTLSLLDSENLQILSAAGVLCLVDSFAVDLFNPRLVIPTQYQQNQDIDWSIAKTQEKWKYVINMNIFQRFAFVAYTVGVPHELRSSFCKILVQPGPLHLCFKCQFWFYQRIDLTSHAHHHHHDDDDNF